MTITKEFLEKAVKAKGYRWFDTGDLNLNIIGIRTEDPEVNVFNDWLCLCYKEAGKWVTKTWPATTDPGLPWLKNPMNIKGAAILVPGQYPVYALSMHRGAYEALCQRRGPVRVYRDGDRDNTLDFDPRTVMEGEYGINIHRGRVEGETPYVEKHSAGCQVFKKATDFNSFLATCRRARTKWGNKFTYTLLEERDFA